MDEPKIQLSEQAFEEFECLWNAYWKAKSLEGPTFRDLDKAFKNLKKSISY